MVVVHADVVEPGWECAQVESQRTVSGPCSVLEYGFGGGSALKIRPGQSEPTDMFWGLGMFLLEYSDDLNEQMGRRHARNALVHSECGDDDTKRAI